jgi:hypothetical protein
LLRRRYLHNPDYTRNKMQNPQVKVHCPVFYLKHDVSETGFNLRLQVVTTQWGRVERVSLCLRRQGQTE